MLILVLGSCMVERSRPSKGDLIVSRDHGWFSIDLVLENTGLVRATSERTVGTEWFRSNQLVVQTQSTEQNPMVFQIEGS